MAYERVDFVADLTFDDSATFNLGFQEEETFQTSMDTVVQVIANLEDITVTPASTRQIITADPGFNAIGSVVIEPIPSNYGLITWNGSVLTVS